MIQTLVSNGHRLSDILDYRVSQMYYFYQRCKSEELRRVAYVVGQQELMLAGLMGDKKAADFRKQQKVALDKLW